VKLGALLPRLRTGADVEPLPKQVQRAAALDVGCARRPGRATTPQGTRGHGYTRSIAQWVPDEAACTLAGVRPASQGLRVRHLHPDSEALGSNHSRPPARPDGTVDALARLATRAHPPLVAGRAKRELPGPELRADWTTSITTRDMRAWPAEVGPAA